MSKAQRSIAGNGSPAADDPSYAIGRHVELARKLGRVHFQRGKLLGEDFAWMNCWSHYRSSLMIIDKKSTISSEPPRSRAQYSNQP
jgi:hypothetical protein